MPHVALIRDALVRGAHDEATAETIRAYGPQILGYLIRVLGSADDAADAFSRFSEQLWRGMPRFQGDSSVRVWAYRVAWTAAMRVAADPYRRRHQRLRTSMASRVAAEISTRAPGEAERESAELERFRSALDPAERSLLVLRVDRRLSWRDVTAVMHDEGHDVDEATLRKRFERLKEKLAEMARAAPRE
jgi:RNA polymerase sigma-70 factor (ECF subfamily)